MGPPLPPSCPPEPVPGKPAAAGAPYTGTAFDPAAPGLVAPAALGKPALPAVSAPPAPAPPFPSSASPPHAASALAEAKVAPKANVAARDKRARGNAGSVAPLKSSGSAQNG